MSNKRFAFGIKTLDEGLIRRESEYCEPDIWSAALVGPDGSGKSILAMHVAAKYLHQFINQNKAKQKWNRVYPVVLYVSTDLSFSLAKTTLDRFGLKYPALRERVLDCAYNEFKDSRAIADILSTQKRSEEIALVPLKPSEITNSDFAQFINKQTKPTLYFLDLQMDSAGDDWHFVNQLLGMTKGDDAVKNLVILDAVEGLEAFVGDIDTFGEQRNRRSRIAQLSRICSNANYNSLFVVERSRDDIREPEQFIADYVFTFRSRLDQDFLKRTIEIEKFRGCWHARGEHELQLRQGKGAFTGNEPNLDEPPVPWELDNPKSKGGGELTVKQYLSHAVVLPSLHFVNRDFRERRNSLNEPQGKCKFGLELLDKLLDSEEEKEATSETNSSISESMAGSHCTNDMRETEASVPTPAVGAQDQPQRDVIHVAAQKKDERDGSITLLLGDAGTHKGRLARRFLSQGLNHKYGVAIYLTTGLIDKAGLILRLSKHLPEEMPKRNYEQQSIARTAQLQAIADRILCRRLSVRHLTSSHLLQIVETQLVWAEWRLTQLIVGATDAVTEKFAGHIHLVIDDWNQLVESHPNIAKDPLFLQTLVAKLKRKRVTALIVSTQPGQPFVETQDLLRFDLRKIDEQHIYTWNTSFFGERRTAITCLNDRRGQFRPTVLELRPDEDEGHRVNSEAVTIGRDFALYQGIEKGNAGRVPLELRLVGIPDSENPELDDQYSHQIRETFTRVFAPAGEEPVVQIDSMNYYDRAATFAEWLDDSRLGRTLVMQIDEFWRLSNPAQRPSLMDLSDYWTKEPVGKCENGNVESIRSKGDYYGVWQALPHDPADLLPSITKDYHAQARYIYRKDMVRNELKVCQPIDRIPYLWDFGFLLADKSQWRLHAAETISLSSSLRIRDVWNSLCVEGDWLGPKTDRKPITWPVFIAACKQIADHTGRIPLDVETLSAESLCSLLLEMWASASVQQHEFEDNFRQLSDRCPTDHARRMTLKDLLRENSESLKIAAVQLLYACPQLGAKSDRKIVLRGDRQQFVASRQWYSTAVHNMRHRKHVDEEISYLALPGTFVTRGDWFLAVAAGSRSQLLAERAIDLLTSRKMNLMRLHNGLGLPTRDVLADTTIAELGTALPRNNALERRATASHKSSSKALSYGDLESLGAMENGPRSWLWRSRIREYDRDCFYLRRWLARILFERELWFGSAGSVEPDTLLEYATFAANKSRTEKIINWKHLEYSIDILKSALRQESKSSTVHTINE